jgi:hypothetical protein
MPCVHLARHCSHKVCLTQDLESFASTCLQAACKELFLVHGSTQQQAKLTAWQRQHCEQQAEHVRDLIAAAMEQLWEAGQPAAGQLAADESAIKGMLREHGLGDLAGGLSQAGMCQQTLRVCHSSKSWRAEGHLCGSHSAMACCGWSAMLWMVCHGCCGWSAMHSLVCLMLGVPFGLLLPAHVYARYTGTCTSDAEAMLLPCAFCR